MKFRTGAIAVFLVVNFISPLIPNSAQALAGGYASAPLNITQTAVSGGVSLSWNSPADPGYGISYYRIQKSTTGLNDGGWADVATPTTSPYTISALTGGPYYFRIAVVNSSGTGAYGYPWTLLYKTTTKTRSGNSIVYHTDASGSVSSSFSRIRYLFENSISASTNYADVDFYKWAQGGTVGTSTSTSITVAPTLANLQVPSPAVPFVVQANVSDLTVFSNVMNTGSYSNAITNGFGFNGRVELWDQNYGTTTNGLSPVGNTSIYDYDDQPVAGSYGSFQVHNLDAAATVFAWNQHGVTNPDIGFGSGSGIAAHADWTFCGGGTCPNVSTFALTIFVNNPIAPGADTTAPTVSRIDVRTLAKNGDTITVRSTEIGVVYLVNQSVTVTNLSSITSAISGNKASVAITSANTNTTLTIGSQNDGLYNLYSADSAGNLSTAILATIKIDNTAPLASSIAINSAGTAILLTSNETITNSSQVLNLYTVSDSGSAISITSTSFSGSVATLTLSRTIPAGAFVTYSYSPSAGTASGRWIDQAGNEMAAISARQITNNSSSPITVTLSVPDSLSKGASATLSVSVSVAGKVSFTIAGKRIGGCLNKVASGTTPITVTCTFKPALTARRTIAATLVPTIGAYPTTTSSVERYILKRMTTR